MANNETTTKFKVDISELKKSMQEARKQVAYANSEFKAVSSSMDDWSKSSDGINAKLKQLKSNLDSQETVLSEYEKTLEGVKKEYGENSKEALEYATKLNNQQAVVNKIKKEMAGYEDALKEVSEAEKIASKTGKDVAEVLADVGDGAENAGDGFTIFKGAVATFVGNGLTALVGGLRDAATSILGLAESTREYRTEMAKLETSFTSAGHSTEAATKTYKDLYAVLGDEGQAVEASNFLSKLTTTQEGLAAWTDICTGVYAQFGSSLPIESLTEAANETAKTGQLTGALADALNWAGINEEEFQARLDECTTEGERNYVITEQLTDLYYDSAEAYKKNNASILEANKAQSDYADAMAKMGEVVEPVTTALKVGFTDLLNTALELFGDVNVEDFISKLQEGFKVLTDTVLPAVKEGLGWIKDNKDIIIAGLAGIAAGFVAFKVASLIMAVTTAIKGFTTGLTVAQVAMKAFNLAVNSNPIGMLVTLILTVITAIVTFIATNDEARAKFLEIWGKIVDGFKGFINKIKLFFTETIPQFVQGLINWIKSNWQAILLFFINPFAGLFKYFYDNNSKFREFVDNAIAQIKQLPEKAWTWLQNTISKVAQFAIDLGTKAKEAGQNLLNKLIEKAQELPNKIKSVGSDIVSGLWNGINDKVSWLKDKISGFVGNVTDWLKDFFEIGSPSKLMADEVGKWLPEGIAVGISDNAKSVLGAMKDLAVDTVGSARAGLSTGTTTLGGSSGGVVNNFTQVINSPKQLSRLDIYRQSKNLLGYAGGGV